MTYVTTNVLARFTLDLTTLRATNPTSTRPKRVHQTTPKRFATFSVDIQRYIKAQTIKASDHKFTVIYGFWCTLLNAIHNDTLSLALISDRPSELPDGRLYLNYHRVTALLQEQQLPYAGISARLFRIIMHATNLIYPDAVISAGNIQSEHSLQCKDGVCLGEHRYCFCIDIKKLPIFSNNSVTNIDADLT